MFQHILLTQAVMREREREIQAILLSKIASQSRSTLKRRVHRRILASLGALLRTWGRELEQRYGESSASVSA